LKTNLLYYGDNLNILSRYIPTEAVDLIYLDPPFNSQRDYNVIFKDETGRKSDAQMLAFEDTWHWGPDAERVYEYLTNTARHEGRVPDSVSTILSALRQGIGCNQMLAYLVEMSARLVELHRVLKPTGSLYLHCDPTASHYLKIVLDAVFGVQQFRNEIIWRRTGSHNSPRRFGPIHDILLFYTKTDDYFYRTAFRPYLKGHVDSYFKQVDENGRRYWTNALTGAGTRNGASGLPWKHYNPTQVGRHWAIPGKIAESLGVDSELSSQEKLDLLDAAGYIVHPTQPSEAMPTYVQYLDCSPGIPLQDIWAYQPHTSGVLYGTDEAIDQDVRWLKAQMDTERLGYPTQKPIALLERIIEASSRAGETILDPFCGCGTALIAAEKLGRRWIGIDVTYLAISVMKARLRDSFGLNEVEVIGQPTEVEGARQLAQSGLEGRYQFQWWAVDLVGATPAGGFKKKGADKGIDGVIGFTDSGGKSEHILVSVKSGHVDVSQIRDLKGTLEREKAVIGIFITLEEPTRNMYEEAAIAGFWHSSVWNDDYARIQIMTIKELLEEGKRPHLPAFAKLPTYRRAPRVDMPMVAEQGFLFDSPDRRARRTRNVRVERQEASEESPQETKQPQD